VFDRYTDELKAFTLMAGSYQQISLQEPKIWLPQLELGLGLWWGDYEGITRHWLRWYDAQGNWILTASEREAVVQEELETERERAAVVQQELAIERERAAVVQQELETERERAVVVQQELETERQRAEAERSRSERLAELLRTQGIDPDSIT
jgi:hypothetical protein